MALTQKQWHLIFVSITIIILGLLLWFCFMFVITTPVNCHLPDEFWSRTDSALPSVLSLFSIVFFLLFILNAVIFYTGKKESSFKEAFITGSGAICNAFLITTLGLILLSLVQSNHDSRVSYEEKIAVPYTSKNRCLQLESFFGKWEIVKNTVVDSSFKDYLLFSRDESIKTGDIELETYSLNIEILDKYYTPEKYIRLLIPDAIKNHRSIKGLFKFWDQSCHDGWCSWEYVTYYFEKTDHDLIFIKADLLETDQGVKYATEREYIILHRIN